MPWKRGSRKIRYGPSAIEAFLVAQKAGRRSGDDGYWEYVSSLPKDLCVKLMRDMVHRSVEANHFGALTETKLPHHLAN